MSRLIRTDSMQDTIDFAESSSHLFKSGNVYGFIGEMASGKTTFIKGLLKGMGYLKMVNSPTFTLINEYDADCKVVHIDCYRESDINRWIDIGIAEYFNSNSIVLIEWPEIIDKLLPEDIKYIKFKTLEEDQREIVLF